MIKRIAYLCEHGRCKKLLLTKRSMKRHEGVCIFNPERKACPTCKNDHYLTCLKEGRPEDKVCVVNCGSYENKPDPGK